MIRNPILRGFCPDPSILRVGGDYYIAVSTFEWWPGVRIYHSADLARWTQVDSPLTRPAQLDLSGGAVNGGVWAPCLSYHDGWFYLAYSDMKCQKRPHHSGYNYAAKSRDLRDWSDGVYVNATGFDPSIFHDPVSGKSYWLNMRHGFRGVLTQAFDRETLSLVGEPRNIFAGAGFGYTEGPHLYYRDGWYYLLVAEGGTGYGHCVAVARSRAIDGEYERCPHNPILTSTPESRLQKAGHGAITDTAEGGWVMAHLCSRPIGGKSLTGRETALQPIEWADGWPRIVGGGNAPLDAFDYHGSDSGMDADEPYSHLRLNPGSDFQLGENGAVTLVGREGLLSNFRVTVAAKRIREIPFSAETAVDFTPTDPEQAAGLALMYNNENFYLLTKTTDEGGQPILTLGRARNRQYELLAETPITSGGLRLRVTVARDLSAAFAYAGDGGWQTAGAYDASWLSDEDAPGFTGLHAALYCHDQAGLGRAADFQGLHILYDGQGAWA